MSTISSEVAQECIDRFVDYYEIVPEDMIDNIGKAVDACLKAMKKAIMKGRLEIDFPEDTIIIKQHVQKPVDGLANPIVYKEMNGDMKMHLDDEMNSYVKNYTLLAVLSGEPMTLLKKMKGKDMSLAECLGPVFLQI